MTKIMFSALQASYKEERGLNATHFRMPRFPRIRYTVNCTCSGDIHYKVYLTS